MKYKFTILLARLQVSLNETFSGFNAKVLFINCCLGRVLQQILL